MRKLLLAAVATLALAAAAPALAADPTTSAARRRSRTASPRSSRTRRRRNTPADDFGDLTAAAPGRAHARADHGAVGGVQRHRRRLRRRLAAVRDQLRHQQEHVRLLRPVRRPSRVVPTNTWLSTGNSSALPTQCRVDTAQISPGTQCSTWAAAVALHRHAADQLRSASSSTAAGSSTRQASRPCCSGT